MDRPISDGDRSDAIRAHSVDRKLLATLLERCLTVQRWTQIYPLVQQHPELMGEEADRILAELDDLARSVDYIRRFGDEQATKFLGDVASVCAILVRCREIGLINTFVEVTLTDGSMTARQLSDILERVQHYSLPDEMPRRIGLLEEAVRLVQRDENPALWAVLHTDLGTSLASSAGDTEQNYDRACASYTLALEVYRSESDPDHWGRAHHALAYIYENRSSGDRGQNLQRAIGHRQQAMQGYRRESNPHMWATNQIELARDIHERNPHRIPSEALTAVEHCTLALEVLSGDKHPQLWGAAHVVLTDCYSSLESTLGAPALGHVIKHGELASQVLTENDEPDVWTKLQERLARAYLRSFYSRSGSEADTLEPGIRCAERALRRVTREGQPDRWTELQVLLGEAYKDRVVGDRADNIECAIAHLESAAELETEDAHPDVWAGIQGALGTCYHRRVHGDHRKNLVRAVRHYESALRIRTKERSPYDWAMLQHNLATAFWNPDDPDRAAFEDRAIEHSLLALEVRTKESHPYDWAATQTNLAAYYLGRVTGSPEESVELAIQHSRLALEVRTSDAFPADWALNQSNLAGAFCRRVRGDRRENEAAAIDHYRQALQVYQSEAFPHQCRGNGRALGDLLFGLERWSEAADAYQIALTANAFLYDEALFRRSRLAELMETGPLFHRAAYALARMDRLLEAVVTLERGRAVGVREAFGGYGFELDVAARVDPEAVEQLTAARQLRRHLEKFERDVDGTPIVEMTEKEVSRFVKGLAEGRKTAPRLISLMPEKTDEFRQMMRSVDHDREARERAAYDASKMERRAAVDRIRRIPGLEHFDKDPTFAQVAQSVAQESPVVFIVSTPKGSLALILQRAVASGDVTVEPVWVDALNTKALAKLFAQTDDGVLTGGFLYGQSEPEEMETILEEVLTRLGELMAPIVARLQQSGASRAVLVPAGLTAVFPLHAARIPSPEGKPRHVLDVLDVTQALSARALALARQELMRRSRKTRYLCGVGNPQPYPPPLRFGIDELREVSEFFPEGAKTPLFEDAATLDNFVRLLPNATHVHLACHGVVDWSDPLRTHLELGDGPLSMGQVLYDHGPLLTNARLVVLSACQSGIPELALPDEGIGLPGAFLQAGVPAVVATLWPVDDCSSALLVVRFYELHLIGNAEAREGPMDPVRALCRAQCWLRDASVGELREYVSARGMSPELAAELELRFGDTQPDGRPFAASPFDWAAFFASGA